MAMIGAGSRTNREAIEKGGAKEAGGARAALCAGQGGTRALGHSTLLSLELHRLTYRGRCCV